MVSLKWLLKDLKILGKWLALMSLNFLLKVLEFPNTAGTLNKRRLVCVFFIATHGHTYVDGDMGMWE